MEAPKKYDNIPKWIIYYTVFSTLLLSVFMLAAYFYPALQFSNLLDISGAKYPIGLYASRDLAVVAGLILALYFGGSRLFLVTFIMRFATDLQDMILTYTVNEAETPLLVTILLFAFLFVTEFFAIKALWPLAKKEKQGASMSNTTKSA